MRRRGFLAWIPALIAPAVVGGCSSSDSTGTELHWFMRLSELLTGFEGLDRELGATYLDSLRADPAQAQALSALFDQAGFAEELPSSLEALEGSGALDPQPQRAVSEKILTTWYTGVIDGAEGPTVVTYIDSLAWASLSYASPPSTCGGLMGFWAAPPAG